MPKNNSSFTQKSQIEAAFTLGKWVTCCKSERIFNCPNYCANLIILVFVSVPRFIFLRKNFLD